MSASMDAALSVSPLTTLVCGVLEWTFAGSTIDDLFTLHAPGQQTRKLSMQAIVELLVQVVAGARRSVFAAFQADQSSAKPTITASAQALYAKVGRTTPDFAVALVRHSAERLLPLLRNATTTLSGWRGYRVRIWDGTDLDGSEHRLGVLRDKAAAGLPGRLVVEYDPASGLCTDAVVSEDAYASEMRLVHPLVARARARQLVVADRNFCTWEIMAGLARRRACFVIREHQKLRCGALSAAKRLGRVPTGVVWEQGAWVEDRHTGRRLTVRRLILKLDEPTREGDAELRLMTNLPKSVAGRRVALLYRRRWTLEGQFDFVKNQLHGEVESLGRPRAALLMMCLALAASNALAVVRQAMTHAHRIEWEELSGYYLADELAGNYRAVAILVSDRSWAEIATRSEAEFWSWCLRVAKSIRPAAFLKHPRGPKKPPPKRASGKKRSHHATYRLLNDAQQRC